MKKLFLGLVLLAGYFMFSCAGKQETTGQSSNESSYQGGQETVQDDESQKDIVKIAVESEAHSTLVKALAQADLVTSMANAGPFTVFAPTNDAFAKIDEETMTFLMKDENRSALQNILEYHVTLSVLTAESLKDGQSIWMANGGNVSVSVKDGKIMINDVATILGSVRGSNGIIHVVDAVLLPKKED